MVMDSVDLEIEANKEKACALAKELKILNQRTQVLKYSHSFL